MSESNHRVWCEHPKKFFHATACGECYRAARRPTLITQAQRFWPKVEFSEGCWLWGGYVNQHGYGVFYYEDKKQNAHRFSYELCVCKAPKTLDIDHLCRNRACVNPDHLEAVSPKENMLRGESPAAKNARKTHCIHGHEFTKENTYVFARGRRRCKECHRIKAKESYRSMVS